MVTPRVAQPNYEPKHTQVEMMEGVLCNLRFAAATVDAVSQWSRPAKCHFQASLVELETLESHCSCTLNHCCLTDLVLWVTFAQLDV